MKNYWYSCLLFFNFLFAFQFTMAQKHPLKIITATQQSWYGGVEGMQGEKFFIVIKTSSGFIPDTFCFKGYSIPIVLANEQKNNQWNCDKTNSLFKSIYTIRIDFSYPHTPIQVFENPRDAGTHILANETKPMCTYLLVYKINDCHKSFCFPEFEQLKSLYYP